ncbi:MAG: MFS transporter, partial [Dehalococcoidia bacterium]
MDEPQLDATESASPPRRSAWVETFGALRYRNFRLLWITTILISGGNWVQQVTLGWLAFDRTGSPLVVSVVLGLRALPMLTAPMAGVMADRFDRRKILMADQAALALMAVIFAADILAGTLEVWHMYVFSFATGIAWSLNNPVRQTLVANSVPPESLMNAIAINSMAFNAMRMVGPAVGGSLIVFAGPGVNFLIQAVMYVAVFASILPYRAEYAQERGPVKQQSPFADLADGFRYILRDRITRSTILMTLVPTFTIMAFTATQLPAYAAVTLEDEKGGALGVLFTSMGVGGLLGTLMLARFSTVHRKGVVVLVSVVGAAMALIVMSFVETLWWAVVLLVVQQFFFIIVMTTNNTILHMVTPDAMRGRVMGIYMLDIGLQPLGGVIAGVLATAYTVSTAWLIGGVTGLCI